MCPNYHTLGCQEYTHWQTSCASGPPSCLSDCEVHTLGVSGFLSGFVSQLFNPISTDDNSVGKQTFFFFKHKGSLKPVSSSHVGQCHWQSQWTLLVKAWFCLRSLHRLPSSAAIFLQGMHELLGASLCCGPQTSRWCPRAGLTQTWGFSFHKKFLGFYFYIFKIYLFGRVGS